MVVFIWYDIYIYIGNIVFDSVLSDSIMVPIKEAYKLGALNPNVPYKDPDEEDEE